MYGRSCQCRLPASRYRSARVSLSEKVGFADRQWSITWAEEAKQALEVSSTSHLYGFSTTNEVTASWWSRKHGFDSVICAGFFRNPYISDPSVKDFERKDAFSSVVFVGRQCGLHGRSGTRHQSQPIKAATEYTRVNLSNQFPLRDIWYVYRRGLVWWHRFLVGHISDQSRVIYAFELLLALWTSASFDYPLPFHPFCSGSHDLLIVSSNGQF